MHYAEYTRNGLPIASGVMEASCKTLVTQRLKQSGMAWTQTGGQAILTLRSLIQSGRWQPAWQLLRADFCKTVIPCATPNPLPPVAQPVMPIAQQPVRILGHVNYTALPLAV